MKRYLNFVKGNWIFALLSAVFVLVVVYLEIELPLITAKMKNMTRKPVTP